MKTKKNLSNEAKQNIATAGSSVAGAAVGVAGATFGAAYAKAAEKPEELQAEEEDTIQAEEAAPEQEHHAPAQQHTQQQDNTHHAETGHTTQTTQHAETGHTTQTTHHAETGHTTQTNHTTTNTNNGGEPRPTNPGGGDTPGGDDDGLKVLAYETVDSDGVLMDVAHVEVGGQEGFVVDVDRDGKADFVMADLNRDGDISDDEIYQLTGDDQVDMAMFQDDVPGTVPVENPEVLVSEIGTMEVEGVDVDYVKFSHNGTLAMAFDVDRDGEADILAYDMDGDNKITEEEFITLEDDNKMDMADFHLLYDSQQGQDVLLVNHEETPVDDEVHVVSYETMDVDGNEVDLAIVSLEGDQMGYLDVDRDGKADIMLYDVDHNDEITHDEAMALQGEQQVDMGVLQDLYNIENPDANNFIAGNDDYINNANVDDFFA